MSELRPYSANGAVAARPEGMAPSLSFGFQSWIEEGHQGRSYSTGDPGDAPMRFPRGEPTAQMIGEAKRVLAGYQTAARGPSPEAMGAWLKMIGSVVRNPPAFDMMPGLAKTFAAVLSDLPAGCFTAETARRGAQTFEFWPSAADVAKLVRPEADDIQRILAEITSVASRPVYDIPPAVPREPTFEEIPARAMTPEQRAEALLHVQQKRADLAEEFARMEPMLPKVAPGGKPLHLDHLRALRDASPLVQGARAFRPSGIEW